MSVLAAVFEMPDWGRLFLPATPALEIVVRGTVMYLGLFLLLRFVVKRQLGGLGVRDVLVIVLLADAAQNGMAGGYRSILDGLLLVLVILFWAWALDWLSFRFRRVEAVLEPHRLPVVRHGRMLRANMERELLTSDELMTQLRHHGVERLDQVKVAYMESDGRVSVVPYDTAPGHHRESA